MKSKPYKVRVRIGKRSSGSEQLQICFATNIERALGASRTTIEFHGSKMCFRPAGNARYYGNYSVTSAKLCIEDLDLIKYARSFEGEFRTVHKSEDGYLYIDAAEALPYTNVLPPRRKSEPPALSQGEDIISALTEKVKRLEKKRDEALEVACECDRLINSLKEAINVMEGGD